LHAGIGPESWEIFVDFYLFLRITVRRESYNYFSNANLVKEVPVFPIGAPGGRRVIEARALQGSGGLDTLSQP
jgi:hypothetical protein